MSAGTQIDYAALAKQAGAVNSQPAAPQDYAALAKQAGATDSQAPRAVPSSWRQPKDPFSGQSYGPMMPPQMATAIENQNRLQGRVGQVQNLVTTPVSNAVAAESGMEGIKALSEMTPGMKAAKAVQAFQGLSGDIGSHPVQVTDKLAGALADIKQGADTGLNIPSVVNKLVTRLSDVEEGPLTYDEARQFYSNLGDLAASDKMAMNAKAQRLVFGVQHALGETIADTTEQANKLSVYQGAMKDFASAKSAEEKLGIIKDWAGKVLKTGAIGAGMGAGYEGIKFLHDLIGQ